jgi:hypothetical protein
MATQDVAITMRQIDWKDLSSNSTQLQPARFDHLVKMLSSVKFSDVELL